MTGPNPTPLSPTLTVRFIGEEFLPTEALVFGREAELMLDENSYLHRKAGRFCVREGTWWLENLGSHLRLTMVSSDGSIIELQPGGASPLLGSRGEVSLRAGPTRYAIEYWLTQPLVQAAVDIDETGLGADTATFGPMLTPREVDFVIVMAQGRLTGRLGPLPSYGEIADIWGISNKTVDNTLQRLRAKLRKADITFVHSGETLVEYLVTQGLLTIDDLDWARIDGTGAPRTAASRHA